MRILEGGKVLEGYTCIRRNTVISTARPSHCMVYTLYLVRRRVGRFVQVDDSVPDVVVDWSSQRGAPGLQWGVVASPDHHTVIVLERKHT